MTINKLTVSYSDFTENCRGQITVEQPSGYERVGQLFQICKIETSVDTGATWTTSYERVSVDENDAVQYVERTNIPSFGANNLIVNRYDMGIYRVVKIVKKQNTKPKPASDRFHFVTYNETNRRDVTYEKFTVD